MNKAVNERFGYDGEVTLVVRDEMGARFSPRIEVQKWQVRSQLSVFDCRRLAELFTVAADIAEGKDREAA